ncbi:MAG: mucoidy inhibitor MuiA family protein [Syntrophales bacterium]|nr:mucoidy inhibitor MuiA family protein [Syntrophales bacterium]
MIKHYTWIRTAAIAIILCLYPFVAGAVPREVTLFPGSARILEVTKVHLQPEDKNLQRAVFFLPDQADPNSLVTRLTQEAGLRIEDQTWRQVARHDEEKIKELRKQIQFLKAGRNTLQAAIFSLETQIQFWQSQTKAKMKTIPDAFNMASAIGKNIQKAYQGKLSSEPELERLNKQIKDMEDELNRIVGEKETRWEVTVLFSGSKAQEALLTYTYSMSGCGWLPLYRLDARPQERRILFFWEAEIWQSSGQDWNGVNISIATLQPASSSTPPELPPWIIKPRPEIRLKGGRQNDKAEASPAFSEADNLTETLPSVPRQIRQSTFSLWQLGKKNIPAGSRQRVKIQEDAWPADFTHLMRPSLSVQAFVRASVNLPEPMEIPRGEATFMVDGAILGKRKFSFAGQEGTFFFGVDPLVTAHLLLVSKKSGEKTFLEDKQTYKWDWRIDVQNARTSPVRVRIEDPCPQARDERIKLSLQHEPPPSEQDPATRTWSFDLPAGQKKSILTTIVLTAPRDMNLDLGWRH